MKDEMAHQKVLIEKQEKEKKENMIKMERMAKQKLELDANLNTLKQELLRIKMDPEKYRFGLHHSMS
jgi:serine protease inhibitor ecotin